MGTPWTEWQLDEALAELRADVITTRDALDTAKATMRAEISVGSTEIIDASPRSASHRPFVPWLVAAAVVAVISLGAAVVVALVNAGPGPSTDDPEPSVEAPAVPVRPYPPDSAVPTTTRPPTNLAELADRCSDRPQRPGQYRYHSWRADGGSSSYDLTNEMWIPLDPSHDWLIRRVTAGSPTPEEFRGPYGGGLMDFSGHWGAPTPEFYAQVPRDPVQIHNQLIAIVSPVRGPNVRIAFYELRNGLTALPAPADLRAAVLRALSLDPGIIFTTGMRGSGGRPAVGVGMAITGVTNADRSYILFDQNNCDVLGASSMDATGAISGHMLVSHAVVDRMGERP